MDNIERYKEIIKEQQEKIDSLEKKIKILQQGHEDRMKRLNKLQQLTGNSRYVT